MLKMAAALLIASGLILPLSSCHKYLGPRNEQIHYVDAHGSPSTSEAHAADKGVRPIEVFAKEHPLPAGISLKKDYKYIYSEGSFRDLSQWLCLLGVLWPLIWVMASRWINMERISAWLDLLTPILLFGTSFVLVSKAAAGNHFEAGYWTTLAGILLFGIPSARGYGDRFRRRFPRLNPLISRVVMTCVFGLGLALPCWQIMGHFIP